MKLFYARGACSLASHIALIEGGLDHTLVNVDLRAKRTEDGEDFSAINPKGYVPALEIEPGVVLTENIAVLLYIGEKDGALLPAAGNNRWRVVEALAFISTELHKSFKPFFRADASEEERDHARALLARRFGQIADQLGDREVLVDQMLSVADCYLFVMLLWAQRKELELPPTLASYYERLKARPAFAQALAEEQLG
jgi:glutathione S-transferase